MSLKSILFILASSILFLGCSKYGFVKLNYPLPPIVSLSNEIQSIAVVNRSLTKEEAKQSGIIEAIATAEIAGSDKKASNMCLKAISDKLNGKGFNIIIPENATLYGSGKGEIPPQLEWDLVQEICESNNAESLLVLEMFDSNSDLITGVVNSQINAVLNTGSPQPVVPNQIRMNVVAYWRMYYPTSKTIIDDYNVRRNFTIDAPLSHIAIPPANALPNEAYQAGLEYSSRFLPSYYTVKRELYKRGKGADKQAFKAAFRSTEVANWEAAIEIWDNLASQSKRKNAGRACLNIAVANEVLGNTTNALDWAKKSYELYGDKLGKDYTNQLRKRQQITR